MKEKYIIESLEFFKKLMEIPGTSGYCKEVREYIQKEIEDIGLKVEHNNKESIYVRIKGKNSAKTSLVCAHVDTLGAMVSEIKPNGRLRIQMIGGYSFGSIEGENCIIHSRNKKFEGSVLPDKASVHIFGDETRNEPRNENTVEIRIDEDTYTREETIALGIRVGDFITFETRTRVLENGYIKSRYLDDRLCVAELIYVIKQIVENNEVPENDIVFLISENEEIGHGISGMPDDIKEVLAVDIGTVGGTRMSNEKSVTIIAKDGRVPYPYELRRHLEEICENNDIPYVTDVLIKYASDASVAVCQGVDWKFACIGPGVDATHHYERTHIEAHRATMKLVYRYIMG